MKTAFSFFILLLTGIQFLHSQDYHPLLETGKLWSTRHGFIPMGTPTSDYTEFEGDTLIGLYTYKHVWIYRDEAMTQKYFDRYIREDIVQRKVFFRYTDVSEDFLLYDFSAAPGDTLMLHGNNFSYILDSVGTYTLLSGEQRRSFSLHSTFPYPCTEIWVEGIGSISRGVMNSGTCGFVGDDPRMLCAWENDTLKFHTPDYSYCFVITGVFERNGIGMGIKVFPNPASEKIRVNLPDCMTSLMHFEVLDLSGRLLLRQGLGSPKTTIRLDKSVISPIFTCIVSLQKMKSLPQAS